MPKTCQTGIATRHAAFEQVFANFPDRLRNDVHGYVAVADCDEMGKLYDLTINGKTYRVAVADCLNRSMPMPTTKGKLSWLVDVDDRLWWAAATPNRPVEATLCELR